MFLSSAWGSSTRGRRPLWSTPVGVNCPFRVPGDRSSQLLRQSDDRFGESIRHHDGTVASPSGAVLRARDDAVTFLSRQVDQHWRVALDDSACPRSWYVISASGRTKRNELSAAVRALDNIGSRLLGLVITMLPTKGPDSYGYGQYGYGVQNSEGRQQAEKVPEHPRRARR